jgi:hypothetical protein
MHGSTPADGDWSWMLLVAPHSATPFDLAQTIGSALFVIGACLLVERADGTRHSEVRLDPGHARVSLADTRMRSLVVIEARGVRVEIGRYLTPPARLELVRALRGALRGASLLYAPPPRPL